MAPRIYIDGHVGTTGLRIREWLAGRSDIELLTAPESDRKDPETRRALVADADLAVLCLPDEASREAAQWAAASGTAVIDASTAHRVAEDWVYGLPELAPGQRDRIRRSPRVSNPGCYPTAVILLLRPLVDARLLAADSPVCVHALSGYTGGGRSLIEKWEDSRGGLLALPFEAPYALDRVHKHVPEMTLYAGLRHAPQFAPAVGPFRCGMRVQIPLHAELLATGADAGKRVWEALFERYREEPFVEVAPIAEPLAADERRFDPRLCNDTNRIALHVVPHPSGHVLLVGLLDNLGKGACGGAIQCLNLMLDLGETTGLPR